MRYTVLLALALLASALARPSRNANQGDAPGPVMRAVVVAAPKCAEEGLTVCRVIVESTPAEISMISSTISYRDPVQFRLDPNGEHTRAEPSDDEVDCLSFLAGGTGKLRTTSHLRKSEMGDSNVLLGTWLFEKNMLPATPHHNTVLQLAYSGTSAVEVPIHLITRSGVRYSETVTCGAPMDLTSRVASLRSASSMPTLATVGLVFLGVVVAALLLRSCRPTSATSLRKQPISIRMLPAFALPARKDYEV